MSMNKGLKLFGEAGIEAVRSKMAQLHDRKVMKPVHSRELTPEEWREALAYLMFLKRKRCGKVKGRGCANGRKQRRYTDRADAASPTVATEAVFLTVVINALENRDVAVVDIHSCRSTWTTRRFTYASPGRWLSYSSKSTMSCTNHTLCMSEVKW
jgi:hypothetical protein